MTASAPRILLRVIIERIDQCSDTILAGDDFVLNGKVIAKCVDVHVVSTEGFCSVVLTNHNWDKEQLAEVCKQYQVEVVDKSGAPHFVVYKGKRANLVKLIKYFWDEYFESDYEMHKAINEHPFLCTWCEGYANPTRRLEGVSFFVDSNGYDENDVTRILALQRGETIELFESGIHITHVSTNPKIPKSSGIFALWSVFGAYSCQLLTVTCDPQIILERADVIQPFHQFPHQSSAAFHQNFVEYCLLQPKRI